MQKSLLLDENIEWVSYPNDRKAKRNDGYTVIVPSGYDPKNADVIPLFCEVCGVRMKILDDEAHKKFRCCSLCADTWAYSNRKEWEKGWRPRAEDIEKVVKNRIFVDDNIRFE